MSNSATVPSALASASFAALLDPPQDTLQSGASVPLTHQDREALKALPTETLDLLRSKLTQLIEAGRVFDLELANTLLHAQTLTYPVLLNKLLILLNHVQALSLAVSAPAPLVSALGSASPPSEPQQSGGKSRTAVASIGVLPRTLSGVPPGKEDDLLQLTRTKPLDELDASDQSLLDAYLPLPEAPPTTVQEMSDWVQNLRAKQDEHVERCKKVMIRARYVTLDSDGEDGMDVDEEDRVDKEERYEWKARIEGDRDDVRNENEAEADTQAAEGESARRRELSGLLEYMRSGNLPPVVG